MASIEALLWALILGVLTLFPLGSILALDSVCVKYQAPTRGFHSSRPDVVVLVFTWLATEPQKQRGPSPTFCHLISLPLERAASLGGVVTLSPLRPYGRNVPSPTASTHHSLDEGLVQTQCMAQEDRSQ